LSLSFMVGLRRVRGETPTGRLEEIRRHLQIPLGRTNIDVTEVDSELGKQSLHILTGAIPCDHPVHCRRVTYIVQPWRSKLADGATYSSSTAYMLEPREDLIITPRPNTARAEKRGFIVKPRMQAPKALNMPDQFLGELWPDWNDPCFEKLRVVDGNDLIDHINVS